MCPVEFLKEREISSSARNAVKSIKKIKFCSGVFPGGNYSKLITFYAEN